MKYIAIDIGSTYVKSALIDVEKRTAEQREKIPAPEKARRDNPRHFEIPADAFARLVNGIIGRCLTRTPDAAGVLLSVQMHGFVYSVPARRDMYVSWQDLRCLDDAGDGRSHLEHLAPLVPPDDLARSGVPLKPSLGLCNLWTMLRENPELPRDGMLYTLGSYIINRLTGNNVCHITSAAPLGMVDVVAGEWNRPLLAKLGLDRVALPTLTLDDFAPCGRHARDDKTFAVYPDWGDQQTAVLGCMTDKDDVIVNIATAAQVIAPCEAFEPGPYEIRPYFERGFYKCISNMPAGRGLAVLIRLLCEAAGKAIGGDVPEATMWKAIRNGFVFDANGITVDSGFFPVGGKTGGGVTGIGPGNLTLSSLFSAAYLDMAAVYWKNIQTLRPPEQIARLVCAGGVSWKNPDLVAAVGRVSGKECVLSPLADEALSGLFRAALVCSGVCGSLREQPDLRLRLN